MSHTKERGCADVTIGGHLGYTAGLTPVENTSTSHPTGIYNLLGQPLTSPQKGFNIIDGKKLIVQ